MKNLGYGKDYRYAHDEADAFAAGETYFPDGMTPPRFYQPTSRGVEERIARRLQDLAERNTRGSVVSSFGPESDSAATEPSSD
jgi:putative ATPase